MHLFIIDQYITLDMFAPIIYKLSKKKIKPLYTILIMYKVLKMKKNLVFSSIKKILLT